MSGASETLDVSSLRYRDYQGGLMELVEGVLISDFIHCFEEMNKNVALTRAQLQECWFHALHREHAKIMSNSTHMTQAQLDDVAELLAWGIEQADSLHWLSGAEKVAANREAAREMQEEYLHQLSLEQKASVTSQQPQNYDPLLLQSIQDVQTHAKLLYKERLPRFLKRKDRNQPGKMLQLRRNCVNMAQQYVINRLKADCLNPKDAEANQFAQTVAIVPPPQLELQNPVEKWKVVLTQLKAEKKKIISELGMDSLIKQDNSIYIDASNRNQSLKSYSAGNKRDRKFLLRSMTRMERGNFLRAWAVAKQRGEDMILRSGKTQAVKQDMLLGIEESLQNLDVDQDTSKLQKHEQKSQTSQKQTVIPDVTQLKVNFQANAEMKNARAVKRRQKKLNKRSELGLTGEKAPARNSFFEPSMAGLRSTRTRRNRLPKGKRVYIAKHRGSSGQAENDTVLADACKEPDKEGQADGKLVMTKYSTTAFKPNTESVKAATQTALQTYKGDEMDIDISGKIAQLEIKGLDDVL